MLVVGEGGRSHRGFGVSATALCGERARENRKVELCMESDTILLWYGQSFVCVSVGQNRGSSGTALAYKSNRAT